MRSDMFKKAEEEKSREFGLSLWFCVWMAVFGTSWFCRTNVEYLTDWAFAEGQRVITANLCRNDRSQHNSYASSPPFKYRTVWVQPVHSCYIKMWPYVFLWQAGLCRCVRQRSKGEYSGTCRDKVLYNWVPEEDFRIMNVCAILNTNMRNSSLITTKSALKRMCRHLCYCEQLSVLLRYD
jgi:hypothetical protein